jgi:hypothetical protein
LATRWAARAVTVVVPVVVEVEEMAVETKNV